MMSIIPSHCAGIAIKLHGAGERGRNGNRSDIMWTVVQIYGGTIDEFLKHCQRELPTQPPPPSGPRSPRPVASVTHYVQ
jgi:hypothetical protein